MNKLKLILRSRFTDISIILAAHWLLLYWLAEKNIVAVLFAAGSHTPAFESTLAITFLFLRVFTLVFVPGWAIALIGLKLFQRYAHITAGTSTDS